MILYEDDIKLLSEVQLYISANLDKNLACSAIAEKFGIDKKKLCRRFSYFYNIPLYQYVLTQRMNTAMHLLMNNLKPVYETALAVGFEDKSAFSHAFTKYFGFSPLAIIKQSALSK